jgi:hypothetical protein
MEPRISSCFSESISPLHIKDLIEGVKKGKVLSTDLTADEKPSKFKLIALSILTLGIYYGVYKYQHDRERVFTKITTELAKTRENYKHILEKEAPIIPLTKEKIKRIENEIKNLEAFKTTIEKNPEGEFVDEIFIIQPKDYELIALAKTLHKAKLKEKTHPDNMRKLILGGLENKLNEFKDNSSLTIEDRLVYNQLKKLSPIKELPHDRIRLTPNYEKKKIDWNIELPLDKNDGPLSKSISGDIDLYPLKNKDILEEIDKSLEEKEKQLPGKEADTEIKKELETKINLDKQVVNKIVDDISTLISSIWEKNKDSQKNGIENEELKTLLMIKQGFVNDMEQQKNPFHNDWGITI